MPTATMDFIIRLLPGKVIYVCLDCSTVVEDWYWSSIFVRHNSSACSIDFKWLDLKFSLLVHEKARLANSTIQFTIIT